MTDKNIEHALNAIEKMLVDTAYPALFELKKLADINVKVSSYHDPALMGSYLKVISWERK